MIIAKCEWDSQHTCLRLNKSSCTVKIV